MANPNNIVIADVLFTPNFALAGALVTTGAFNTTFVQQASVSITLPATNGTLALLTDITGGDPTALVSAFWG